MSARRPRTGLRVPPAVMRIGVRQLGSRCLNAGLSWQVQRSRLEQLERTTRLPKGTTVSKEKIGGVPAEVVSSGAVPPGPAPAARPTVIHFHGGGYCVGSASTARGWAAHLSGTAGCTVVLPEYRLAPEHPHPAAGEDAAAVVSALAGQTGIGSLVLSGDSAGGGLALALALSMRDAGQQLPAGCILVSPWLDLGGDHAADAGLVRRELLLSPRWLAACARAYADPSCWSDPLVSPLRGALGGLMPLLIQAGTEELLVTDADQLAAGAAASGVDVTYTRWPGMWHDFALQPGMLAAADSALAQAAWFVRTVTSPPR
jgi:epsilon-lactone hydrolase